MPPAPLRLRRPGSSSLPTLISLSKLLSLANPRNFKRAAEWSAQGTLTAAALASTMAESPDEPEDPPGSPQFVWKLCFSAGLVLLGGVFAGLVLVFVLVLALELRSRADM